MSANLEVAFPDELVEQIARRTVDLLAEREPERAAGWLNAEQAADYLACPQSRIYDLVQLGRLRRKLDGRRLLFRPEWLDAALKDPE